MGGTIGHIFAIDAVLAGGQIQNELAAVFGQIIVQDLQGGTGAVDFIGFTLEQPLGKSKKVRLDFVKSEYCEPLFGPAYLNTKKM